MLQAPGEQRPGMLLNILEGKGQAPQQRTTLPKMPRVCALERGHPEDWLKRKSVTDYTIQIGSSIFLVPPAL